MKYSGNQVVLEFATVFSLVGALAIPLVPLKICKKPERSLMKIINNV